MSNFLSVWTCYNNKYKPGANLNSALAIICKLMEHGVRSPDMLSRCIKHINIELVDGDPQYIELDQSAGREGSAPIQDLYSDATDPQNREHGENETFLISPRNNDMTQYPNHQAHHTDDMNQASAPLIEDPHKLMCLDVVSLYSRVEDYCIDDWFHDYVHNSHSFRDYLSYGRDGVRCSFRSDLLDSFIEMKRYYEHTKNLYTDHDQYENPNLTTDDCEEYMQHCKAIDDSILAHINSVCEV